MNKLTSICVFCGSSDGNDRTIVNQAYNLGLTLAQEGISLVYGGAKIGVMGKVAEGVLTNGGHVIGVIPEFLKLKEIVHTKLTKLITTKDMHERKMKMHDLSDGFITLPGGFGTLEELLEILTWAQLGIHQKPIGILNIDGFYDQLLGLLKHMVTQGFLKKQNFEMIIVDGQIDGLLHKMKNFTPSPPPEWLKNAKY